MGIKGFRVEIVGTWFEYEGWWYSGYTELDMGCALFIFKKTISREFRSVAGISREKLCEDQWQSQNFQNREMGQK